MSVTVYSSTDSSAPTIARTAGAMITFFDKVLVSGYGTQSSCGWTKLYGDTAGTQAVYKSPSALGDFSMFVFDDVSSTYSHWWALTRFCAGTATGLTSCNTTKWPMGSGYGVGFTYTDSQMWQAIVKTTTNLATTTAVRWSLINNTSRGFYLWIDQYNETAVTKPSVATFYSVVRPKMLYGVTDTAILTIFRSIGTGSINWFPWDLAYPSQNISGMDTRYVHKTLYNYNNNGSIALVDYLRSPNTITGGDYVGAAATNYAVYPSIDGNMQVTDINMGGMDDGYTRGSIICRLPGILMPLHNKPLNHGDTIAGSSPYASSNYVAWCAHSGQVLIDTTDNWG